MTWHPNSAKVDEEVGKPKLRRNNGETATHRLRVGSIAVIWMVAAACTNSPGSVTTTTSLRSSGVTTTTQGTTPTSTTTTLAIAQSGVTATQLASFVGDWYHHGIGASITAEGLGTLGWRTYTTCGPQQPPPCDTINGNEIIDGGHATFELTSVNGTTATGHTVSSDDPASLPVGSNVTAVVDTQHNLLYLTPWPGQQTPFCGPSAETTTPNPCGA